MDPPIPDANSNLTYDYVAASVVPFGEAVVYQCLAGYYFSHNLYLANFALNCNSTSGTWDDAWIWQVCVSTKVCPDPVLPSDMTTTSTGPFIHDGTGGDNYE